MFKKPATLYQRFVNAFQDANPQLTKEKLRDEAAAEWRKIKHNQEEIEKKILELKQKKARQRSKLDSFWSSFPPKTQKPSKHKTNSNSANPRDAPNSSVASSSSSSSSSSSQRDDISRTERDTPAQEKVRNEIVKETNKLSLLEEERRRLGSSVDLGQKIAKRKSKVSGI